MATTASSCVQVDCDRPSRTKGMCQKHYMSAYNASDAGRAAQARYRATDTFAVSRAAHNASDSFKAYSVAATARYRATDKGKAARAAYSISEARRAMTAKYRAENRDRINAYKASDEGRAAQASYEASDKGRAVRATYRATDAGKAYSVDAQAKYRATPKYRDASQRGSAMRRAREAGATFGEPFTHADIFDRDRWTCGLCDLPVDRDLAWPDPGSASLDHVIPLAKGGEHSEANAQLAHLVCNVSKGSQLAA